MSDYQSDSELRKLLEDAFGYRVNDKPRVSLKRVVLNKTKHSENLAERIQTNAEIVDKLIDVIKALNRKPSAQTQVDQLIDIVKHLLDNNARLREDVGEVLRDVPTNG